MRKCRGCGYEVDKEFCSKSCYLAWQRKINVKFRRAIQKALKDK